MPGLKVVWRDGVAYAAGSVAGERVRKSLGTRDPAQARELCAQYEARLWKRRAYGDEAVKTFGDAALSYMEAGGEARYLPPLITRFGPRVLGTIKPEEVRQAGRELGAHLNGASRNRQFVTPARAVINHAADLGWCRPIRIKAFQTTKPHRRTADRTWIDRFMDQAAGDGLPHLAAAVLFMWQTAARISEAAGVFPEHVDLGQRIVLLASTKEGEWEVCHITRELMIRIANLPKTEGKPLFGYASRHGLYQRMRAVCRRAGLPFIPPHQAGRHSFASNTLEDGASLRQVMEGGRWKTARLLLETYAHANRGGRSIAERFDAANDPNLAQPVKDRDENDDAATG